MSNPAQPAATQAAETQTKEISLLDSIVEAGRWREPSQQERGKDMVKEFINQVLQGQMTLSRDADATIASRIAQIDHLISVQLNEVIHHPSFQKLEATWRGVKYLMDQSETSASLKIKLFNAPKRKSFEGSSASARIRPKSVVQKCLHRRVRYVRWCADCCYRRRLRNRSRARGHGAASEDRSGSLRRSRSILVCSFAGVDESDRLYAAERHSRYVEGLRQHGIREMEGIPRVGRFRGMWR